LHPFLKLSADSAHRIVFEPPGMFMSRFIVWIANGAIFLLHLISIVTSCNSKSMPFDAAGC
jgi:hypothetical protein